MAVIGSGLLGCSGNHKSAAPQPPSTQSIVQTLVSSELAPYYPPGQKPPPPGPFQQALLSKSPLTFADYQSAIQAAADCIQKEQPGTTVQLVQEPGWTQLYNFVIASGSGAKGSIGGGAEDGSTTASADSTTSTTSSDLATEPSTVPNDTTTTQPQPPATLPSSIVQGRATIGYCLATYSAEVEARWHAMQTLSGPQLTTQRTQFLQCMQEAGITVQANTDNQQLGRIFNDPSTYQKLSPGQMKLTNDCTNRFQQFLFSIAPP